MVETAEARRVLTETIEEAAAWRRRLAETNPSDSRNPRSAAGLEELAGFVQALPADDPELALIAAHSHAAAGSLLLGESLLYALRRFRQDRPEPCRSFLGRLARLAVEDADQHRRYQEMQLE